MKQQVISMDKITIRYTPKDTSEITTRDVEYKSERLKFGKKEELRKLCNPVQYFEYDYVNVNPQTGAPGVKSINLKDMQESLRQTRIDLARICFGIVDLPVDSVVSEDMETLIDLVIKHDPARIEKDKKEAEDIAEKKGSQKTVLGSTTSA